MILTRKFRNVKKKRPRSRIESMMIAALRSAARKIRFFPGLGARDKIFCPIRGVFFPTFICSPRFCPGPIWCLSRNFLGQAGLCQLPCWRPSSVERAAAVSTINRHLGQKEVFLLYLDYNKLTDFVKFF